MVAYRNGRAPAEALVIVDGVHMVPTIAPRVRALMDAAARDGRTIRPHRLGGYRTLEQQRAVTMGGGSTVPVAPPGQSTHGIYTVGRVDLVGADGYSYTQADLDWIIRNAPRFGLFREFGTRDPNHFMETGTFAVVTEEEPNPQEEEDMFVLKSTGRGEWLIGPGHAHHLTPEEATQINALRAGGIAPYPVKDCGSNDRAFDLIMTAHTVSS